MDWDDQELVAEITHLAFVVAYAVLRDRALAQDAAQEALLRLWQLSQRQVIQNPSAAVRLIAQREALRILQREQRRQEVLDGYSGEAFENEEPAVSADARTLSEQRVRRVIDLIVRLLQLTALQRRPIVRQSRGLTDHEIASTDSRTAGAIRESRRVGFATLEAALSAWSRYDVEQSCDDLSALEGLTVVGVILSRPQPHRSVLERHFRHGHAPERIAVDLSIDGGPAAIERYLQEGCADVLRERLNHGWPRTWPPDEVRCVLDDMRVVATRVGA